MLNKYNFLKIIIFYDNIGIMKKVSIIMPVYNKEKYVQAAIQSALNQTYKNIEIVVIDDASTDGSYQAALELANKHSNIILHKEKINLGVSLIKNKAISMATGEYIYPLDADDYIDNTLIEKFVKILDNNPQVGVVYCNCHEFQSKDRYYSCNVTDTLIYSNCFTNGSMYRKKDFYKVGQYKEWLNRLGAEDWELWISFFEKGYKFEKIDEYLYHYRIDNNSKSMVDICNENMDKIKRLIFEHHSDLYKKDKDFIFKVFDRDHMEYEKHYKRGVKYKKLFNIFLPVLIVQLILNVVLIVLYIVKSSGGGYKMFLY